jgi:predicted ATPase/class 3 adenylate cyclase
VGAFATAPSGDFGVHGQSSVTTFLFTDVEGSTVLWEQDPERMREALARHDAFTRAAVGANRGELVKMSGDGAHAAFEDPFDALAATLELQRALADPAATNGVHLRVRCGLHMGVSERRENDFFGPVVNRAARIMSVAHGGQVLLSEAVATLVRERLPPGVALRDLGAVRLRDLSKVEHVYQVLHSGLRDIFPALRSLEAIPNNLPQQLTSFIGRESELSEIRKLLRESRLLTLVGLGGIGKTRLSLHAAAHAMADYPDGVWFVELAPLTDGRLVPQAVASVLGVREEAGRPVLEALLKYVKGRRLLIILDNCEHLVQASAELAMQLLQSGPQPRVLASSREGLHVSGEAIFPVSALAVPDSYEEFKHTALAQYAAARLFIDRTVAVQPAFEVTASNATAVAEICRRLDGIPLALELAAARARALSVEQIAVRLEDRFRLLTGGNRAALPRQQTLRALIDWSYDLLTEDERVLLRRLAVFAGGWTVDAAEAVGAGGTHEMTNVLDLLTRLVEKSLVAREAPDGGRYRLLETVRQYAQEKLIDSGEDDDIRTRHLAFYLSFAERADPKLRGPDAGAWLSRLDLEGENLLSAHAWCDRADGGAALGLRLVHSVKRYFATRGLFALVQRATVEALARPDAQRRDAARSRGLFDAGQLDFFMGRYGDARRHLEESLSIAREIREGAIVAMVLQPLGMAALGEGDLPTARCHLEEALALARHGRDKPQIAAALNALAQLHRVEGKLDTAEPLYEQVLMLARELRDRESIAIGLLNLAMVLIGRDSQERARKLLLEVQAIAAEIGSKPVAQSLLDVSAGLAARRREWVRTARFFGSAEAQAQQTALRRDPADEAFLAPLIVAARIALGDAAFTDAENSGRGLTYENAMEEAQAWLQTPVPGSSS